MEDFNGTYILNDTQQKSNFSCHISVFENFVFFFFPTIANKTSVTAWIVICVGFPLSLLAIYSLYSLVQDNNVTPVFVINLLISDLILICCLVFWVAEPPNHTLTILSTLFFYFGVLVSVSFMMCIALERFLVVAFPLWYHFKQNIKFTVFVSVGVWVLGLIEFFCVTTLTDFMLIFHSIFLLFPFPVLIFCLVGTLKSLLSAISVTPKEKLQIIGTLVLVLLIYTLLFLPWVTSILSRKKSFDVDDHSALYLSFLQLSPLADLVLYVFMRKGAVDRLLACLCCGRMTGKEEQSYVTTTTETKHRRSQFRGDRAEEEH